MPHSVIVRSAHGKDPVHISKTRLERTWATTQLGGWFAEATQPATSLSCFLEDNYFILIKISGSLEGPYFIPNFRFFLLCGVFSDESGSIASKARILWVTSALPSWASIVCSSYVPVMTPATLSPGGWADC